jgi:phenylalanyl-tRNA synthetase beta chain
MPKIEVNEKAFFELAGKRWTSKEELEEALICAKAELDGGFEGDDVSAEERTLKIELNDTNRPDLWGTAGCARQLRLHNGGKAPVYPFFSTPTDMKSTDHKVKAEKSVRHVRPFITGFVARGKEITDPLLRDMIQTQEKLAGNFGRKRKTISMGLYRTSIIKWPIIYKGVDPDSVSFVPLQWDVPLTLTEILKQHPKGKEYAFIQQHEKIHPLLTDSTGAVLSYPPIINSADLGAVQVGDSEIFVELTGTDQRAVDLAGSIMACDLADSGFTIEPVEIEYEYDTPSGRKCVTPCYFQERVFCSLRRVEKFLGEKLSADECAAALTKMGVRSEKAFDTERGAKGDKTERVWAWPPEYRTDFLHAADVAEDVMIGRGLNSFKPEHPHDFTVGRLTPVTLFSRRLKELMAGLGYQEMIYNYLGSRKDFVEKMHKDGKGIIRISNPMTENYEYVRDSILASLMASETVSGHSVYPHRLFEIGKVAYWDNDDNYSGAATRQYLGFLHAGRDVNFNTAAAQIQTLFYYVSREYEVQETASPIFISGRSATLIYKGRPIGIFGEIHPEVLENWGVTMPCTAGEFDIESLL